MGQVQLIQPVTFGTDERINTSLVFCSLTAATKTTSNSGFLYSFKQ